MDTGVKEGGEKHKKLRTLLLMIEKGGGALISGSVVEPMERFPGKNRNCI